MRTAARGRKRFKEMTRVSGERPIGAASFRHQSSQASCQTPAHTLMTPTHRSRSHRRWGGMCVYGGGGSHVACVNPPPPSVVELPRNIVRRSPTAAVKCDLWPLCRFRGPGPL